MRTAIEMRLFISGKASSSSPVLVLKVPIRIAERGEIVHYSWLKLNKGRKTQVLKTLFLVIKPEQKFNSKTLFEIIDRE